MPYVIYEIRDVPIYNTVGKCNNPHCTNPNGKIFWNPAVINSPTGKLLTLNRPFHGRTNEEPDIHRCMVESPPGVFIKDGKVLPQKTKPGYYFTLDDYT